MSLLRSNVICYGKKILVVVGMLCIHVYVKQSPVYILLLGVYDKTLLDEGLGIRSGEEKGWIGRTSSHMF